MNGRPPKPTLFPSPTLFRSNAGGETSPAFLFFPCPPKDLRRLLLPPPALGLHGEHPPGPRDGPRAGGGRSRRRKSFRSEEHTSELQSLRHLVCRLLLEKKRH